MTNEEAVEYELAKMTTRERQALDVFANGLNEKTVMTHEEILKQAIEKASNNGFTFELTSEGEKPWKELDVAEKHLGAELYIRFKMVYQIIFSHDFAKAFWGEPKGWKSEEEIGFEDEWWMGDNEYHGAIFKGQRWHYHLQQLVLEEDPIKYLEKFL